VERDPTPSEIEFGKLHGVPTLIDYAQGRWKPEVKGRKEEGSWYLPRMCLRELLQRRLWLDVHLGKSPLPEDEPWDSEDSANTSSSENTEAEGNVGTKSSDDDSGSEDEEDELDEGGKPNPASARSDDKGEDFDKEGQSGGYESDDS
jgi:hypothetical protein